MKVRRGMCDELPPKRIPIASSRALRSICKLGRRSLRTILRCKRMTRAGKRKVGRGMEGTRMCDLPADLVEQEILARVPITSLRAVRSTCKLWDSLTKEWLLGKSARHQQFLGFIIKDSKVCSARFNLCRRSSKDKDDEDEKYLLDLSIKQVDLLDKVAISRVFHCNGLLLCVAKYLSSLLMWNPYLGQTEWIGLTTGLNFNDCYALGYDINRNHKILRSIYLYGRVEMRYEIYEFNSNSWRVLEVTPDWKIESSRPGLMSLSVKGNTYFYAHGIRILEKDGKPSKDTKYFLLSFDFTTERFGPRLPLPFHTDGDDNVAFSCLREEKLAVLYNQEPKELNLEPCSIVQIWVTNTIAPDSVSWSPFLKVENPFACTAIKGILFDEFFNEVSFFIDEEEKLALVFDLDAYLPHTDALVIGEGGYLKPVSLGVARIHFFHTWSSSYLPSLVQLNNQGQVPPPPPNLPTVMFHGKFRHKTSRVWKPNRITNYWCRATFKRRRRYGCFL